MNQGARDANAESSRMAAKSTQDQILTELKEMNQLLRVIASHVQPQGGIKYYIPGFGLATTTATVPHPDDAGQST